MSSSSSVACPSTTMALQSPTSSWTQSRSRALEKSWCPSMTRPRRTSPPNDYLININIIIKWTVSMTLMGNCPIIPTRLPPTSTRAFPSAPCWSSSWPKNNRWLSSTGKRSRGGRRGTNDSSSGESWSRKSWRPSWRNRLWGSWRNRSYWKTWRGGSQTRFLSPSWWRVR